MCELRIVTVHLLGASVGPMERGSWKSRYCQVPVVYDTEGHSAAQPHPRAVLHSLEREVLRMARKADPGWHTATAPFRKSWTFLVPGNSPTVVLGIDLYVD